MRRPGKAAFLGFLISVGVLGYLWTLHSDRGKKAAVYTRSTVDVVGVKYDLLTLAKAEHSQFVRQGRFVSLDELLQKGEIARTSRPPYTYEAELGDTQFRISAVYSGQAVPGSPRRITIDDKFEFVTEE